MFSGSFLQMNLSEVVRLLSSSMQTGALMITPASGDNLIGAIYLHEGQLIDAYADGQYGLDALKKICSKLDANFTFEEGVRPDKQSLINYMTSLLLDKIQERVTELGAYESVQPNPTDIPQYIKGKDAGGLQAAPDELALLLLCKGNKTVADLAEMGDYDLEWVSKVIGKFRKVGLIALRQNVKMDISPSPETPATSPDNPLVDRKTKHIRYWRGKKIS
ncbi:MAG: DUF4388 domain-containing protein [Verrucomicrobiota bacterium]